MSVGVPRPAPASGAALNAYNPDVKVIAHEYPLHSENALDVIKDYEAVMTSKDHLRASLPWDWPGDDLTLEQVAGGCSKMKGGAPAEEEEEACCAPAYHAAIRTRTTRTGTPSFRSRRPRASISASRRRRSSI